MADLDRNKCLEEIDGEIWDEAELACYPGTECFALRTKPLCDYTVEDLRAMIAHQLSLEILVPIALEILNENPLAHGDFFPGDLMAALLTIEQEFWRRHPAMHGDFDALIVDIQAAYQELMPLVYVHAAVIRGSAHGNIFDQFDFAPGEIVHNSGALKADLDPGVYSKVLSQDLLQVSYPYSYVLDIGWYADIERFIIYIVQDLEWDMPVVKTMCRTITQLHEYVQESILLLQELIEREQKEWALAGMNREEWPFEDPPNAAVFTTSDVIFEKRPVLWAWHDAEDGDWQFHAGFDVNPDTAVVLSLREMIALDPAIAELADLPEGWVAWREDRDTPWQRKPE